jgi:hypothetical protein
MPRIPTSTDPKKPIYSQVTGLDGSEYQLVFEWNQRNGFWYLTLRNTNGADIVSGLQLVTGWPLTLGLVDARLPPGDLMVYDLRKRNDGIAGLINLGDRYELLYLQAA